MVITYLRKYGDTYGKNTKGNTSDLDRSRAKRYRRCNRRLTAANNKHTNHKTTLGDCQRPQHNETVWHHRQYNVH